MIPFKRKLKKGNKGQDVEAVGRALCKANASFMSIMVFSALPKRIRRTYGFKKMAAMRKFQKRHKLPVTGVYNLETHKKLVRYFDLYAAHLYKGYSPPPPPPKLVKPRQGFSSLDKSLWEAYSLGRGMGMSDLGTYNPSSRLPGGGPSDHAVYPAMAFDLGISPTIGYNHPTARKYFNAMIGRPEIEYIILGNKIWSRGRGLHSYYSGGHENHIHVSGRR